MEIKENLRDFYYFLVSKGIIIGPENDIEMILKDFKNFKENRDRFYNESKN